MRRPHTKSRNGCKECKQRKVKCDEARPACSRCVASKRQCSLSFFSIPTSSPLHGSGSDSPAPSKSTKTLSVAGEETHSSFSSAASPLRSGETPAAPFLNERYSLCHLELLFYLKDCLSADLLPMRPMLSDYIGLILQESFKASYLMDEVLAFAAAHKSTVVRDGQVYRLESMKLQSRALEQFNSGQVKVTDENCITVFTFSTLLGQHTLFDTFSPANELSVVLNKLIHCINLHQGIRAVAGQSWGRVGVLIQSQLPVNSVHMSTETPVTPGSECDGLLQHLRDSDMTKQTLQTYKEAVQILQYLFDSSKVSNERYLVACQEWLVRVSKDFVSLVDQRRPEALVVIAFHGVLLHRARDHWTIGDAGRFLIQAITSHLGHY